MKFVKLSHLSHGEHLAVLRVLRPRTAYLDFVYTAGLEDIEWTLEPPVGALDLVEEQQVTVWPGSTGGAPRLLRRCGSAPSIFMAFRQQAGFFVHDGDDRLRHTGFGSVDVSFRDERMSLIAYTNTNEGYVALDGKAARSSGLTEV